MEVLVINRTALPVARRYVHIVQKFRPRIGRTETNTVRQAFVDLSLERIVVGDSVESTTSNRLELRIRATGRIIVLCKFISRNLIDIAFELQIGTVTTYIGNFRCNPLAELMLNTKRPLVELRNWRVIRIIVNALAIVGSG